MKKIVTSLICLTLCLSLCMGCGSNKSTTNETTENGGEGVRDSVNIAISAEFSNMSPFASGVLIDRCLRENFYETLVYYNDEEFEPLLSEEPIISDDGLKYTFKIKQGVKFHNGDEMTVEDVLYSYESALATADYSQYASIVKGCYIEDDDTFIVELNTPYAPFLLAVASRVCIINKAYTEAGGEESYNEPIGTGPYKFVSREAGSNLKLTAFEEYHGTAASIKDVTFTVIADASSAQMSLEAGDIDLTYMLPSTAVATLEESENIEVARVSTMGSGYLLYNLNVAPFTDINFRKAIQYAVDREMIIKAALDGIGTESYSLFTLNTVGCTGTYLSPEYDIEKAKEYLEKSSYDGETIKFIVGNDSYKRLAVILQEVWSEIGLNIEIEMMEANAWMEDMNNGNYQMSFVVMTKDPDADLWTNALATSGLGVNNRSQLSDPEIDEAFEKGRVAVDLKDREEQYDIILKKLSDEALVVPVYYRTMTPAYNSQFEVVRFESTGYARVIDMNWK